MTTLLVKLSILAQFPEDSPVSDRGVLSKCMWHVSRVAAQNRFGRRRQVSGNCVVSASTEFVDTSWLKHFVTYFCSREPCACFWFGCFMCSSRDVGVLARGSNASTRIHEINMIMWLLQKGMGEGANGNLVKKMSLFIVRVNCDHFG